MSKEKSKLPRATIDQAKVAWEAHPKPSVRKISDALEEAGLRCSIATLQRWHASGWTLKSKTRNAEETLKQAQAAVSETVKRQDDKAMNYLDEVKADEITMKERSEELNQEKNDGELARQALRQSLIAQIVLSEQVIRRAAWLVLNGPDKVAKVIEALKGPFASTTAVQPQQQPDMGNGDGAKVINGRVIEESLTQLAIASFKMRQRQGVAA